MIKEKEAELTALLDKYECVLITEVPMETMESHMSLLTLLESEEIIANWRVSECETEEGCMDIAVFGWGEPFLPEDKEDKE